MSNVIELPDQSARPEHSPLGASGAERWINCPGSVALIKALTLPESDEPEYRTQGTGAHAAAAHCLSRELDTWEITGQTFEGFEIDDVSARHIQTYLSAVRPGLKDQMYEQHWIEFPVSSPVHPDFYGTLDFGAKFLNRIEVTDFKFGEGIAVDVEDNPQLKYYGFGLIEMLSQHSHLGDNYPVILRIVQPRIVYREPVQEWTTSVGEIREWVNDTLVPAMCATEYNQTLDAGPWCRFCPAKLVCPLLTSLFRAAATYNPKEVVNLTPDSVGRSYQYVQGVKFYLGALEEEAMRRLNTGEPVPGCKLVPKKSNRVFSVEGQKLAPQRFGDDAYKPKALKGPAELEKLNPKAASFVKEYAFQPNTGETVALDSDPRPAVVRQTSTEAFAASVALLQEPK